MKVLGKTVFINRKKRIYSTSQNRVRPLSEGKEKEKESLGLDSKKAAEQTFLPLLLLILYPVMR